MTAAMTQVSVPTAILRASSKVTSGIPKSMRATDIPWYSPFPPTSLDSIRTSRRTKDIDILSTKVRHIPESLAGYGEIEHGKAA